VRAFLEEREYRPGAPPFAPRFDYVASPFEEPATKDYIEYPLAHTICELWNVDNGLFSGYPIHAERLRSSLESGRSRPNYKNHGANFQNTIRRNLCLYKIGFPTDKIGALASWISENNHRCPAQRLGYEVFHKLLKNLMDVGEKSDIPDFAHISCIPYVDAITLDNRMRGYVAQVDQSVGTNFSEEVYRKVDEIEALL
jgi:hypothetical protein